MGGWKRTLAIGLGGAVGAWLLGRSIPLSIWHDALPAFAKALNDPDWLLDANTYPLELVLMQLVSLLPVDPTRTWLVLGAVSMGLMLALVDRIAARLSPTGSLTALVTAVVLLTNPSVLQYVLGMSSVSQMMLAMLFWTERRLAGDVRGLRVALALLALARLDGALLAVLLGALDPWLTDRAGRLRTILHNALLLGVCGLAYPLDWQLTFGHWWGLPRHIDDFLRAMPQADYGAIEVARWIGAGWLENLGNALLLLGALGGVTAAIRLERAPALALLLPLLAHHAILVGLGLAGSPLDYRYFAPNLPHGALLVALGTIWLLQRLEVRADLRGAVVTAIVLGIAMPGYLGNLRRLGDQREHDVAAARAAALAEACLLRRVVRESEPPLVVVPGGYRGAVIYRLREATGLREIVFEKDFLARPPHAGPTLWFHETQRRAEVQQALPEIFMEISACGGAVTGWEIARFTRAGS